MLSSESASAPVLLSVSEELLDDVTLSVAASALIVSTRFLALRVFSFSVFSVFWFRVWVKRSSEDLVVRQTSFSSFCE